MKSQHRSLGALCRASRASLASRGWYGRGDRKVMLGGSPQMERRPRPRRTFAGISTLLCMATFAATGPGIAQATMQEVGTFGSAGSEAGQWESPRGLAVDQSTGDIYVADTGNNRIDVFNEKREFVMAFGWGVSDGEAKLETCTSSCQAGLAGSSAGQLNAPTAIAVDPASGDLYVVDSANSRVEEFTATGAFVLAFGTEGTGAGEFEFSSNGGSIAVDANGDVYVADHDRVQKFGSSGSQISEMSTPGVRRIAVDATNNLYVDAQASIFSGGKVTEYAENGAVQHELSATYPQAVTSGAPSESAYVVDYNVFFPPGEIFRYDAEGKLAEETGVESLPLAVAEIAFANTAQLLYVLGEGTNTMLIFAPPPPPVVEQQWASGVATTSANLNAQINPETTPTEYQFEYGTTTSYADGKVPVRAGSVGSGSTGAVVSAHVGGLQPDTTYYYRVVATSSGGITYGTDETLTTFAADEPTGLPDGRGYELVSTLPGKNGANVEQGGVPYAVASEDGEKVAFELHTPPAEAVQGQRPSYMASRSSAGQGWSVTPLEPVQPPEVTPAGIGLVGLSANFSSAVISDNFALDAEDQAPGSLELYLREADGAFTWLSRPPSGPKLPASGNNAYYVGGSAELGTVVWQQEAPLTSTDTHTKGYELYDRHAGKTQLVGILPNGEVPACGAVGGEETLTVGGSEYDPVSPVSANGESVVFESPTPNICTEPTEVYVRHAGSTVEASESQRATPDPDGIQPADYAGESADGSRVFFTSSQELTNDDTGHDPELYEYAIATGKLTRISAGDEHDAIGDVVNVQAVAPSGAYVYFEAEGEPLAPGAVAGAVNLYVYDTEDAETKFIADSTDSGLPSHGLQGAGGYTFFDTETTPDGEDLLFDATGNLTRFNQDGYAEVYLYSVESDTLTCVSCDSTGARPTGPAGLPLHYLDQTLPAPRAMTNNGSQVFFTSPDALVPQAAEGVDHVYEYEDGRVFLVSAGQDTTGSTLAGTSASGEDVFFATSDRLVPRDGEGETEIYDARIGGGEAEATVKPCIGEECQGPLAQASVPATATSSTVVGAGNLRQKSTPSTQKSTRATGKCARGTVRRKGKCVSAKRVLKKALQACTRKYHNRRKRRLCKRAKYDNAVRGAREPKRSRTDRLHKKAASENRGGSR